MERAADIPFFILAGGRGVRARPLSDIKPKPLFPLNGTPLLETMLTQIAGKGLKRGFVNLHHKAEEIEACLASWPHLRLFHEEILSGSRILRAALDCLADLLLVVNGDVFLDIPVQEMWTKLTHMDADGLLLVRPNLDEAYASLEIDGDLLVGVRPDKERGPKGRLFMYTGAALLKKRVVEKIEDTSFFDSLKRHDFKIGVLPYNGPWLDMGTPRLYYKANFDYLKYLGLPPVNVCSRDVSISPDSRVEDSILWEETTVSGRSCLSHCIVTGRLTLTNAAHHHQIITPHGLYDL
jgi:NDP-sugar pyrophosphorylase family protein